MQNSLMALVESASLKEDAPEFEIGDTVDVHVRILEGEKERVQIFNGIVIARSGAGVRETFTVRRIVQGEGVERVFPVHSPRIAKVVVKRSGRVRRAKLYYLRGLTGKAVRLKERFKGGKATAEEARAAKAERRKVRLEAKAAKKARKAERKAQKEAGIDPDAQAKEAEARAAAEATEAQAEASEAQAEQAQAEASETTDTPDTEKG